MEEELFEKEDRLEDGLSKNEFIWGG